jgi:3-isopropylmalate dehydrogenase
MDRSCHLQAKKLCMPWGCVHEFVFEDALIGAVMINKTGSPPPEQTLNLCINTDAVLFEL